MRIRTIFAVTPDQLVYLMSRVADGTITLATARLVFKEMWERQRAKERCDANN